MNSGNPKIAVVGAGSIGLYYGGLLAASGCDVHFLLRSDYDEVRKHGIRIVSRENPAVVPVVQSYRDTASIGPCDLVIIALKATSNGVLTNLVPPLLGPHTTLLTLQNGLGNEALLARSFPGQRILGGLCFVCLNRIEPGVVEHFGHGTLSLGQHESAPTSETQAIGRLLSNAGVKTTVVENLLLERWRKLVWNVPFNGLAIVAGNATVDIVLSDPILRAEALALMQEVILGAGALGLEIPMNFTDFQMQRSANMGPYKPSSLIDYLAGRPVEVESIWGEPLRQSRAAGMDLPKLALLHALLGRLCPSSVASGSPLVPPLHPDP